MGYFAVWASLTIAESTGYEPLDQALITYVLVGVVVAWAVVALEVCAVQVIEDGRVALRAAIARSWKAFALCVGIVVCGTVLFGMILIVPLLGLLAVLYLYVRLVVAFEESIATKRSPIEAMRGAWTLTRGHFWLALGRLVFQYAWLLALGGILALIPANRMAVVAVTSIALPMLTNFRVLSYFDFVNRQPDGTPTQAPVPPGGLVSATS